MVVQPIFIKIQTVVVRARANSALERTPLRGDAQLDRSSALRADERGASCANFGFSGASAVEPSFERHGFAATPGALRALHPRAGVAQLAPRWTSKATDLKRVLFCCACGGPSPSLFNARAPGRPAVGRS